MLSILAGIAMNLVSCDAESWSLWLAAGGDLRCLVERDLLEGRVCGPAAIHLSLQACRWLLEGSQGLDCALTAGESREYMYAADKRH
jgi:hypothetical protein